MKKALSFLLAFVLLISLVTGCSSESDQSKVADGGDITTLKLAHNLNEQHTVHQALTEFARLVKEKSDGNIMVEIYPNGQLGSETEALEQLQAGALAMTKVSAAALTTYEEGYNAFTLPYVFSDQDHFFKCMESDTVQELYQSTLEKGFLGLTYYNSGARSFYTANKPILTPEDLKGLKIRVMGFQSQADMVKMLGGTPVGMPYGELYTSLQSGVIDGAENNETALTNGKHGEVAKHFSLDEHTRIPDILVISSKVWNNLTSDQQKIIKEAAIASTEYHKPIWNKAIDDAKKEASETMSVEFYEVDKKHFRNAVEPMLEKYKKSFPRVKELLDTFDKLR